MGRGSPGATWNNCARSQRVTTKAPTPPIARPAAVERSANANVRRHDAARRGAERHAHADFAPALRHQEGHHAGESDGGQQDSDGGECREQRRLEARASGGLVEAFVHGRDLHRQSGVERGEHAAQRGCREFRVYGRTHNGNGAAPAEGRFLVCPRQVGHRLTHEIILRAAGLVGARVTCVSGHPHHGEPLALGSALDVFAERILSRGT